MKSKLKFGFLAAFVLGAQTAFAAGFPGLIVEKVWVQDGRVVVRFSDSKSDPTSIQTVRSAYTENFSDYKNVLALLLTAKANEAPVRVYTGSGGTPLPGLIEGESNFWASTIRMISIE